MIIAISGPLTCSLAVEAISEGTNCELDAVFGIMLLAEGLEVVVLLLAVIISDEIPSKSRVIFHFFSLARGTSTFRTNATSLILDLWQPSDL